MGACGCFIARQWPLLYTRAVSIPSGIGSQFDAIVQRINVEFGGSTEGVTFKYDCKQLNRSLELGHELWTACLCKVAGAGDLDLW